MITFKSVKPATKFKSSVFREKLRARAQDIGPKMAADMKKPTLTWQEPVEFKTEVSVGNAAGGALARKAAGSASGVSVEVTTTDARYKYLDEGTKVRYATMSRDFRAKTKPNSLNASRGRGKLLFVNKRRPRPGIKARNFTKLVHDKWQPEFRKAMQAALNEAGQASGHSAR